MECSDCKNTNMQRLFYRGNQNCLCVGMGEAGCDYTGDPWRTAWDHSDAYETKRNTGHYWKYKRILQEWDQGYQAETEK